MKFRVVAACTVGTLALAVTSLVAESTGTKNEVRIDLDAPAPTAKPAAPKAGGASTASKPAAAKPSTTPSTKAPAKPGAPKKDDEKKTGASPKIDGFEVARGDHGYLGVKIVNGNFKITFYGKDKKPAPVDVSRAALRWPVQYQKSDERVVLMPSDDGKSLLAEKVVRPPFSFKLFITLLKDTAPGEDPAAESYVVDFQQ